MRCECGYFMKGNECFSCGKMLPVIHKEPKIKQVGKSMASKMQEYSKKKREFMKKHPMCKVFPNLKATDIHHKAGRTGEKLLDERYWISVSREGHQKIHDFPLWAKEQGFSISRLKTEE